MDTRIREAVELHADTGLRLSGIAVRYGDIAGPPRLRFRERIEPGAFGNLAGVDVRLNRQHDRGRLLARTNGGGLELHDSPDALRFTVQLPDTADARDVHTLVRSGVMRGASIEYDALRERQSGGVSVVERARLSGLAIVDSGAYADSLVEARAEIRQSGRGIEGSFYYDVDRVTSDRESMEPDSLRLRASRKTRVSPGAFAYTLRDPEREVQLLMGPDFGKPLASVQAGTLQLEDVASALNFIAEILPETSYVADLRAAFTTGAAVFGVQPLYRVPPPDVVPNAVTVIPEPGNPGVEIEVVNEAVLTGIAVVSRPPRGNPGSVNLRGAEYTRTARRRLWL